MIQMEVKVEFGATDKWQVYLEQTSLQVAPFEPQELNPLSEPVEELVEPAMEYDDLYLYLTPFEVLIVEQQARNPHLVPFEIRHAG